MRLLFCVCMIFCLTFPWIFFLLAFVEMNLRLIHYQFERNETKDTSMKKKNVYANIKVYDMVYKINPHPT